MLESGGGGTWRWLDNPVLALDRRALVRHLPVARRVMSELYPLVRGIEGYRVALLALLPLVLGGSALVAELSWRLVESPPCGCARRRRRQAPRAARADPRPARQPRERRPVTVVHVPHDFDGQPGCSHTIRGR